MLRSYRNIVRLLEISRILARHDALFLLETLDVAPIVVMAAKVISRRRAKGRPGQRLARALQEAGPSFIKLGQALSTRADLLGEEMAADLSELQDQLPPFSGAEARAAIEAEFDRPLEELFPTFELEPVAAASIAQVHFAVTADGREVAVKVLRPGVETAFDRDLDLFLWVAELIEATRPEFRRMKPVESVRTLAESVEMEMDLRLEAAAAVELSDNFKDDETFDVPDIDWTLTGKRILTSERVAGIPLDDRDAIIAAGHDPETLLTNSAVAFFKQVFRDGFFHADLHPGNLFVDADGVVVAVDFGIMGRLDRRTRRYLGEMLLGFLTRDYARTAQVHFDAGWVPAHRSVASFTQACRSIGEPILDRPQNEISIARLLGQLFRITETFEMESQPQLLLLQKTMLVAEGTGRALHPDANMWILARPLIEAWVDENFGAEAIIAEAAMDLGDAVRRLPRILEAAETAADAMAEGNLKLHPETIRALRGKRRASVPMAIWWGLLAALGLAILL